MKGFLPYPDLLSQITTPPIILSFVHTSVLDDPPKARTPSTRNTEPCRRFPIVKPYTCLQ